MEPLKAAPQNRTGPTKRRGRQSERGVIEFLEEAVQLLRLASPGTLAAYYLGSVPFVVSFLYFLGGFEP